MSQYKRKFDVEILTPQGAAASAQAVSLVLPAADGQLGVLADRAPLMALLGAGALRLERADGSAQAYFVAGGFARVLDGAVTILAEQCVPLESLSPAQAQRELDEANGMPADDAEAGRRRRSAVEAAKKKLSLARQAHKTQPAD